MCVGLGCVCCRCVFVEGVCVCGRCVCVEGGCDSVQCVGAGWVWRSPAAWCLATGEMTDVGVRELTCQPRRMSLRTQRNGPLVSSQLLMNNRH